MWCPLALPLASMVLLVLVLRRLLMMIQKEKYDGNGLTWRELQSPQKLEVQDFG